jgi:hypothetical protein
LKQLWYFIILYNFSKNLKSLHYFKYILDFVSLFLLLEVKNIFLNSHQAKSSKKTLNYFNELFYP